MALRDDLRKEWVANFEKKEGRPPSAEEMAKFEAGLEKLGGFGGAGGGPLNDFTNWVGDVFTPEKAKVPPTPFSAPAGTPGGKTSAESMVAGERNLAHYTPGAEMSPAMQQHLASGQARGQEGQALLGTYGQQAATYGVGAANAGQNAFGIGLDARAQMGQAGRAAQNYALNSGAGMVGQGQNAFSAIAPGQNTASSAGAAMFGAGNQLAGLEATQGPSAAQAQLNLATDQAMAQQLALARSGRGMGQNTQALAQAQRANAAMGTQAANQSAMLRAQEDAAWRQRQAGNLGAAGSLYGNAGQLGLAQGQLGLGANAQALGGLQAGASTGLQGFGQNLGAQQAGTGAALQGAQQNMQGQLAGMQGAQTAGQLAGAGYGIGFTGDQQGMQAVGADMAAKQAYEQMLTQQKGIEAGVAINNAASANQFTGAIVGGGASALGGAMVGISDLRAKENIAPVDGQALSLAPNRADMMADYQSSGSQTYAGPNRDVMYNHMRRGALTEQRSAMDEQRQREAYSQIAGGLRDFGGALQRGAQPVQPYFFEDVTGLGRSPYVTSDEAAKTDLRPAQGYTYNYIDPARHGAGPQLGVMAQDLERTPAGRYAVDTGPDGLKRVDTSKLTMVNTAALSDEQRRNDELESRLRQLEDMLFGGPDQRTTENTYAPKGSSGSPKGGPSVSDVPSNAHAAPARRGPLAFETFDPVQAPPKPEIDMVGQRRLRERTPLPVNSMARAAAGATVDSLVAPVRYVGEMARRYGYNGGQANAASELDGYQAVADVEALIRDETTTESRERQELGRQAHPNMTAAGDVLGGVAAGAITGGAQRVAPGVRTALDPTYRPPGMSDAAFAARQRRMQRGGVNLSGPTGKAQTTAAPKPPSVRSAQGKAPAPDEQLAYYTDKASTSVMSVDELKSAMRTSAEGYDYSAFNRFARELEKRAEPRGVAEPAPQQPTRAPRVRSDRPLPAFDRRRVQAARTPDMLTRRNARETGAPMASTPAALSAVERLAMRAEKNVRGSYHGDLSDRAREQLTQAREFWEANPEYVAQTNTAAEFLTRHPDVGSIRRMASSSEGFNARLRTEAQRTREYMEHEPRAPWKGARGVVHGGSPKPDVDHQRRRIVDRVLQDALKAGHGYKGTVYRGLNINRETLDSWIESGVVNQKSFWSTSANDKYVAKNAPVRNWDEAVILRLETKNGVPIEGVSSFPHEHELLIPPGRGWRIKNVSRDADGRHIIDAEEIPRQNVPEDAPHSAFSRASDRRVA